MCQASVCWLCQKSADDCHVCAQCRAQSCSNAHKFAHQTSDRCKPVRVAVRPEAGSCLIATRNIKAGELVFRENPAVIAPSLVSSPVCLACLSSWPGEVTCSSCGFPVCNATCQSLHAVQQDCKILSKLTEKPVFEGTEGQRNHPALALVGVIRLLGLRETDPDLAERVDLLMDHMDDIKGNAELYNMWRGTAVQTLVHHLPGSPYTEQDIMRAVGILHTNSVAGLVRGHALYPTFSLINHSCVSNTRFQIYPDHSIVLRAQVDISAGEEITIQYLTPLVGTMERRSKMMKNWFFACLCKRCRDPTELGTFISAISCRKCEDWMLPSNPVDLQSEWKCLKCESAVSNETVQIILGNLQLELDSLDPLDVSGLQKLLESWKKVLHPSHYLTLQLKRSILNALKAKNDTESSVEMLKLRIALAEENLSIFDILDPGLTILRGRMIQHINGPKLQLAKANMKEGKISKQEFLKEAGMAMKNIKLASICFEDYELGKASS